MEFIEVALIFGFVLLFSGAWCLGVNTVLSPPYLLEDVGQKLDETFPSWVNKPLWRCPPCMASVHGITIYTFILAPQFGFLLLVPFVVCLAGFNYFLTRF